MVIDTPLHRRSFLASAAVIAAGCSKRPEPVPPPPLPTLSPEDAARVLAESEERRKWIAILDNYRAGPGERRETPKPPVDMTAVMPELKTQIRSAIRLHPRYGQEPPPDDTKLGGRFLWPAEDKWPMDPVLNIPMAPVLQLRDEHAPPPTQVPFRITTNLMQVFWTARDPVPSDASALGELTAHVAWRRRKEITGKTAELPDLSMSYPSLVPVPCRLHAEWVAELPDWSILIKTALRPRLQEWMPPLDATDLSGQDYYSRFLAAAPGIKVGGWSRVARNAPNCKVCQWPMDYLLTIDTQEWTPLDAKRWRPEQDPDDEPGRRSASGLKFKNGRGVEIFLCHRCDAWPARALVV